MFCSGSGSVSRSSLHLPHHNDDYNYYNYNRLWVHEAMRHFCDCLVLEDDMDAVFQCIRSCVKTIFRENFDSAFEHLGKVDGRVTQLNLRNLLFGSYLGDGGCHDSAEVQGFDQFEKTLHAKISQHNDDKRRKEIDLVPIRSV